MTPSPRATVSFILALQIALLTIGITKDYQLKHEDNNALHATFARAHLYLGLQTTRGQNYYYTPASGSGTFYANHPPGPGLVLAAVYHVTGRDGPFVTRATAILFHVASTLLFLGLVRRVFVDERTALLATLVFVLLPESAFFGRMVNHEVMALPGALLVVRSYWEMAFGGGGLRWGVGVVLGSVWAALAGWVGFFVIAACALHAAWERGVRRNGRAGVALGLLGGSGVFMLVTVFAQLAWVTGGDLAYLRDLLVSRAGSHVAYDLPTWMGRIVELHWRYFSLTGIVALGMLAYRGLRGLRCRSAPEVWAEVGLIFLSAGVAYVVVFNLNAARHDYWQFLFLPASAMAIAKCLDWLATGIASGRRRILWLALSVLVCVDLAVSVGFTLSQRHLKSEAYCLETVEVLRRDAL